MKAVVLGSGGWGTALALVLNENGHETTLWSAFQAEAETIRAARENPMLKGVALPETLAVTSGLDCCVGADLIVMAPPSFAVRETAKKFADVVTPGTIIVSVSKGMEKESCKRLSEVIDEELGGKCPVAVLCGPSHAEEVGRRIPTACVASSPERKLAERVQDAFMNPRFRVYTSPDVVGAEVGAALKNVIALSCGISDGMGLGDNTKAMLMTRGLTEIARLGVAMGAKKETFAGLTGVGDLIVTCTSMHSRNRRAGILIGQGKEPQEAVKEIGAVVEGYYAADAAHALAEKLGVEMPIASACWKILYEGKAPREVIFELMTRNRTHEAEESWIEG